jgi:hypothetical protein
MGKGKAYTAAEDQHLCTAWVVTSEDPITGTGQKKDAFWKSITATFQRLSGPVEEPRTLSSLQCRWASINKDATKFNGIFTQLKSIPRSGWNHTKYEEEALKLYKEEVKEDFKFLPCWVYLKEKPKWVNTSGFIRPAVAKKAVTEEATQPPVPVQAPTSETEVDAKPERPMGQKAAKLHRSLSDKQASADERTAMAMELRAESHKDYLHYKIMSKMGDSEIAKQWFQLMAEEALLEKKQKLNERKRVLEKQEAREAKALKKSTPPATIECSSNTSAASAVSSSGAEAEAESSGSSSASKENEPPKVTNVVCCAGDYCFFGEHIREQLTVVCYICNLRCHKQCSDTDEDDRRYCDLCGRKKLLEV